MFGTMEWQIQYLLLLQQLRDITHGAFDNVFLNITILGELVIPLTFIAIVYWGINKKTGTFILFNFALMLYINVFLKMTACIKRPWIINPQVCPLKEALPMADGYSFPSGHTAGAISCWGAAAYKWWHNKFLRNTFITIVLLVAFSRNYVGVHTPQDVIVSIIVGCLLILGTDKLLKFIESKSNRDIIFYITALVMTALLLLYLHIKCCTQMETYNSQTDIINPLSMKHGVYYKLSFMLGTLTGWILEKRFVNFEISNNTKKKVIAVVIGLIGLYAIMFLFKDLCLMFFVKHIAYAIFTFVTAIYITLIYPMVLKCLRRIRL